MLVLIFLVLLCAFFPLIGFPIVGLLVPAVLMGCMWVALKQEAERFGKWRIERKAAAIRRDRNFRAMFPTV